MSWISVVAPTCNTVVHRISQTNDVGWCCCTMPVCQTLVVRKVCELFPYWPCENTACMGCTDTPVIVYFLISNCQGVVTYHVTNTNGLFTQCAGFKEMKNHICVSRMYYSYMLYTFSIWLVAWNTPVEKTCINSFCPVGHLRATYRLLVRWQPISTYKDSWDLSLIFCLTRLAPMLTE